MKNVIITGAGMVNKGSQAMLFSTINGILMKYPNAHITCLTDRESDFKDEVQKQYKFEILPWYNRVIKFFLYKFYLVPFASFFIGKLPNRRIIKRLLTTLKQADVILSPNGYNIGSRWFMETSKAATNTIKIAKRFNKKIYLLSQSFGPFTWEKNNDKYVKELKKILKYPEVIYCRESEGYNELKNIGITNTKLQPDLVICDNSFENISSLINKEIKIMDLKEKSEEGIIGIIINENVLRRGGQIVSNLYEKIIKFLCDNTNKKIIVIKTSSKDELYLKELKKEFTNNNRIAFDLNEYNAVEIMYYMKNFDFIIGSRYHSIIFAYYSFVPAVIIGWSEKYKNLAAYFSQDRFVISIEEWDEERLYHNIKYMINNYKKEKEVISNHMPNIKKKNVFTEINF